MPSNFGLLEKITFNFARLIVPVALILVWIIADRALKRVMHGDPMRRLLERVHKEVEDESVPEDSLSYRAATVRQLLSQLLRILLGLFMCFWILDSVGVDLRPVIASIGIVSLGISLAAQNIIRDFLNGFMILAENQYNVGDWLEIGKYSGTVEKFTLRSTQLRDFEGNLVMIPNGTIQTVVNYTKDWAVAVVNIGITYEADYEKAKELMQEVGDVMYNDGSGRIVAKPLFQGITEFSASSVNMRILLTTSKGKQWEVAREYREKLFVAFNANNVPFAYPQLVVHMDRK